MGFDREEGRRPERYQEPEQLRSLVTPKGQRRPTNRYACRKDSTAIGVKATFPGFIEFALATSVEKVPSGARWIHEIKFDGYRVQLHIANEDIKVYTRRGNDWTKRFKKIATDAYLISAGSAIID